MKSTAPPPRPPAAAVPTTTPPPVPPAAAPATTAPPKSKALRNVLIAAGCLLPIILLLVVLIWVGVSYFSRHSETAATQPESRLQAAITSAMQADLTENKQTLYDKIHLAGAFGLGTAKSDVIQSVSLKWKGDRMTDNAADLLSFTVIHTLYWNTPVTSDGHTKFRDSYDCSGGNPRLAESKVVESNGDTIEGVTNALIDYAAKEFQKDLQDAIRDASKPTPSPAR